MRFLIILIASVLAAVTESCSQDFERLFQAEDFTAENLFSRNIEGPAFDAYGNLYVVNFQRDGTVGIVGPDGKASLFLTLPEGSTANSIQFDSKNNMYLADFTGHNILKVNMKTKKISTYVHNDSFNQPNDLCISSRDVIFASDPNWKEGTGKLWRVDKGGKAVLLSDQMGTTNGIELSPDERTLYVNESVQRSIWAFDLDQRGNISNKRLLISFDDYGFDGMKCDQAGNLFVTRHGKGTVVVISPGGDILREVQLKGKLCSNLVFGGLNGKLVFVTLQDRKGMEKFRVDTPGRAWKPYRR